MRWSRLTSRFCINDSGKGYVLMFFIKYRIRCADASGSLIYCWNNEHIQLRFSFLLLHYDFATFSCYIWLWHDHTRKLSHNSGRNLRYPFFLYTRELLLFGMFQIIILSSSLIFKSKNYWFLAQYSNFLIKFSTVTMFLSDIAKLLRYSLRAGGYTNVRVYQFIIFLVTKLQNSHNYAWTILGYVYADKLNRVINLLISTSFCGQMCNYV